MGREGNEAHAVPGRVRAVDASLLAILGRQPAPVTVPDEEGGWCALVRAAADRGLAPLLVHRLAARGLLDAVPAGLRHTLARWRAAAVLRAMAREAQLGELYEALAAADVPVAPLKGALLASRVHESPELRPTGDLDLLVPPERIDAARTALAALGYRPDPAGWSTPGHRHVAPLRRRGRLRVELHHTIEPCAPPFRLPLADLWAQATVETSPAGAPVHVLAPGDALLHVAVHMGHSHVLGATLVPVSDVLAWLERHGPATDWDALVRRAHASGGARFLWAALALAEWALAAPLPAGVLRALQPDANARLVAHAARLLVAPVQSLMDATAATSPRDTAWTRMRRLGRVAVRLATAACGSGAGRAAALRRGRAAAGVLVRRGATYDAIQDVRALRAWAAGADASRDRRLVVRWQDA